MSCIVIDMCVGNLVVTKQPQQIQASETETESELDLECFLPHFYVDSWLKFFLEEARKGKIIQVVEDYGASIGGVFFCEKREETRIRKEYPEEPEIIFYFNQQDS